MSFLKRSVKWKLDRLDWLKKTTLMTWWMSWSMASITPSMLYAAKESV